MAGSTTDSGSGAGTVTQPALVTSAPGAYWNTSATWTAVANGTADVTVNDSQTAQTWEGFGGAFNELGWSYLSMLSQSDRDNAIQLLFGVNGAHFTMGRIPIGASDYALQRYTEDETTNDTSLNNFSISQDMMYLIPYITAAMKVSPNMRFWASPWTPPTWMKTRTGTVSGASCGNVTGNGKTDTSVFDGGCMQDVDANLKALAQYFVKWINAYGALNPKIVIDTLAPQNEPNYATGYPSALWTPALYTKFIGTYLAPALSAANLSTKIMLGTMSNGDNGSTSKDLMVVQAVMADATAKSLVKVMGLQWGMLDLYESLVSGVSKSNFMTGSLAGLGDRAQVWQLSLEPDRDQFGDRLAVRAVRGTGTQRSVLWRRDLGLHPQRDHQSRGHRLQRLEHGARYGRQGERRGPGIGPRIRCWS